MGARLDEYRVLACISMLTTREAVAVGCGAMASETTPRKLQIAVGGIGHETNSFSKGVTPLEKFLRGGEFPAAMTGDGQGCVGAPVADEAFERLAIRIVDALKAAGPLDAVYLDLHGSMMTESLGRR
ncbi:hypothetical protein F503_03105 [Ophiostoma piceae UAMH 11346]|uniref:Microcystin LR degradation protein MlrC N-terminal domain-containing protein n=1 Tax=Ophiostoma piceae (strain UAMH 11346) TaxID=1262450 RepID=S3CJQ9_OPHP1|nr:hypothetical protein F503_03105 [Ophiostoma piceae UAMH 11346]